jgi:two-component system cell cycle response regulator CtrA
MTLTCPLCAQPIPDDGRILVDLDGGLVVGGGHVAQLTRQEFTLFEALWTSRPRTLSKEQLLDAIYALSASSGDVPEIKIIDVFICKARKKLVPLGVVIETAWGKGYRITNSKGALHGQDQHGDRQAA